MKTTGQEPYSSLRRRSLSDPLAAALLPPLDESPVQREVRIKAETEARRVSESIDEMIRKERAQKKRAKADVNVLLLGQSESGKSTTLKQALSPESDNIDDHDDDDLETASVIITSSGRPPSAISGTRVPNYDSYRTRLAPLADLEDRLIHMLSSPDEEEPTRLSQPLNGVGHFHTNGYQNYYSSLPRNGARPTPTISIPQLTSFSVSPISLPNDISSGHGNDFSQNSTASKSTGKEVAVHAHSSWKRVNFSGKAKSPKTPNSGEIQGWWEDPDDPVHVLNACGGAMQELWQDLRVRQRLRERRIRLEESSGFFLDDIPRITAKNFIADVLKARLKTTGVVEHTFSIPSGKNQGVQWRIYDVGGSRNQRQAWAPYFDDGMFITRYTMCSNQVLAEDPRVNRLEDSLLLWKAVVSNKLLAKVSLVLFLNKIDLLKAEPIYIELRRQKQRLRNSVEVYVIVAMSTTIPTHGVADFRHKFAALHHNYTPNKEREAHSTSIVLVIVWKQRKLDPRK
ncbi:hypothetical protein C0993_009215 [Termitomyces sp. T159_Od127]|nr:hypothetical protein C0993_009215 [Termitomyces sp. T159_Od127]